MIDILDKQTEVIESLVTLNKKIINLLEQYISIEEYEYLLHQIVNYNDVII